MITKLTVEQAGNLKGIQASILGKYGIEAINEAWERLCTKCGGWPRYFDECDNVLPLTLNGNDCPYYQKKESE